MSQSSAPWLAGLDGTSTWNSKPSVPITTRPTSVTHDASSVFRRSTSIQRRSLSGNSTQTLKKARSPLAPLHTNENASARHRPLSEKEESSLLCDAGTIQHRSKSSSPTKKQATLEWRKRLLYGKTEYGEQTNLFGPSGLENIFDSGSKEKSREAQSTRPPFSWIPKSDATIPSSPPPWPLRPALQSSINTSSVQAGQGSMKDSGLGTEDEEDDVASDQFDLHLTAPEIEVAANSEPVNPELVANRTFGALTELEQEDFSPVFVSKHTTADGKIDYAPIDHEAMDGLKQCNTPSIALSVNEQPAAFVPLAEESVFTDGSSRYESICVQDLSLSENLPTGTPEPLGRFVQVQRGGYSVIGSFKHRPLSVEPSATDLVSASATDQTLPPAPTPPLTAAGSSTATAQTHKQTPSTPLKLFAAHDTFTNNRLLHRMSEFQEEAVNPSKVSVRQVSFGKGDLDDVPFDPLGSGQRLESSPASDAPVPGSRLPQAFKSEVPYDKLASRQSLGKRLRDSQSTVALGPASPIKASTPKRRRTLHNSELLEADASPTQISPDREVEDPELRERARAPTPLQRHVSRGIDDSIKEATEEFLIHEEQSIVDNVLEAVEESLTDTNPATLRERAEAVASEVAKFTLRVGNTGDHVQGMRKPSVTTQDFFREAECVMEYIRSRAAQKKSMLNSVAEDDVQDIGNDSLIIPKGSARNDHMRISREPSREDRPRSGWREPEQQRLQRSDLDANRVASQLRRWKEPDANDEQDVFLADTEPEIEHAGENESSEIVYDQQAQIRITGPSSEYARRQDGEDSRPSSQRSAQSSSRRTDNVGTLAPSAVAHLIGSEVGGMTFDRDKQRWIRTRSPEHKKDPDFLDVHQSHVTSEDDPFREISDLAVDEGIEKRRISSPARLTVQSGAQAPDIPKSNPVLTRPASFHSTQRQLSVSDTVLRPQHFNESGETYNAENVDMSSMDNIDARVQEVIDTAAEAVVVQKEFKAENGTTSSAPEADFLQRREETTRSQPTRPSIIKAVTYDEATIPTLPRLSKPALLEQSEVSFIAPLPGDRMISVSLSVSKPVVAPTQQLALAADSSPLRNLSTLMLSDLPDFTVNDDDAERPSERAMAQRFARYAQTEAKDRFAIVTKDLTRALTDAHPEEMYWDDLRALDVSKQSLGTLHGLSVYCNKVLSLDASGNALTQLEGAPISVRKLKAISNQLSSLTRFAQLHDLQSADISGNRLDNLLALSSCIHLRELRVDENRITSIAELRSSDLLSLRCRHNVIESLHFEQGDFESLTHLDLSHNCIGVVTGLERLTNLKCLDISNNSIRDTWKLETSMPKLKRLYLRHCNLSTLDVSKMPNLEVLDVDDNMLQSIKGLESLESLQLFSMRRQKLPVGVIVEVLDKPLEAHTVRLSGNILPQLQQATTCLSVRHLELAAVGLTELPATFGLKFSNLRTLNLNHNSIKDLKPLLNINTLHTLHVAGNRVSRLRKVAAILAHLPMLANVDLRDNPVTQRCYSKLDPHENNGMELVTGSGFDELDEDEKRENANKRRYVLPTTSAEQDNAHLERLDEETRLRRRVYELLLAHSCRKLKWLDGLVFDKSYVFKKDEIWSKLLSLGVVRKSNDAVA